MPALKLSNVKLLESSIATKELNARLKKLSTVLSDMSQDDRPDGLASVAEQLVDSALMAHQDQNVRAFVACCLADILRIFAPNAPYEHDQLQEIFRLFTHNLTKLSIGPSSGRGHGNDASERAHYVLDVLATSRSVFVLCDLYQQSVPNAEEQMREFVECIFTNVRAEHLQADNGEAVVGTNMLEVLAIFLVETEPLPPRVLEVVLNALLPESKHDNPAAFDLAKELLHRCEDTAAEPVCSCLRMLLAGGGRDDQFSDSELSESIIPLIYELHKIGSGYVKFVLPLICERLQEDDVTRRQEVIWLLAKLFSTTHTDFDYVDLCQKGGHLPAFLGRFRDIDPSVRIEMVTAGLALQRLRPKLGGELAPYIERSLMDPELLVRRHTVHEVCDFVAEDKGLQHSSKELLDKLHERSQDRKSEIRKEVMTGLGEIFATHVTKPHFVAAAAAQTDASDEETRHASASRPVALPRDLREKLGGVPGTLLRSFTSMVNKSEHDLRARLLAIFEDRVLPKDAPPSARARALLTIMPMLNETSGSIDALRLTLLQRSMTQTALGNFVRAREQLRATSAAGKKKSMASAASKEPSMDQKTAQLELWKRCDELVKFVEVNDARDRGAALPRRLATEVNDGKVFQMLATLSDPTSKASAILEARDEVHKKVGSKSPLGIWLRRVTRTSAMGFGGREELACVAHCAALTLEGGDDAFADEESDEDDSDDESTHRSGGPRAPHDVVSSALQLFEVMSNVEGYAGSLCAHRAVYPRLERLVRAALSNGDVGTRVRLLKVLRRVHATAVQSPPDAAASAARASHQSAGRDSDDGSPQSAGAQSARRGGLGSAALRADLARSVGRLATAAAAKPSKRESVEERVRESKLMTQNLCHAATANGDAQAVRTIASKLVRVVCGGGSVAHAAERDDARLPPILGALAAIARLMPEVFAPHADAVSRVVESHLNFGPPVDGEGRSAGGDEDDGSDMSDVEADGGSGSKKRKKPKASASATAHEVGLIRAALKLLAAQLLPLTMTSGGAADAESGSTGDAWARERAAKLVKGAFTLLSSNGASPDASIALSVEAKARVRLAAACSILKFAKYASSQLAGPELSPRRWHSLAWLMHDSSRDVRRTLSHKLAACTDVNLMMGTRFTLPFLSLAALDADKELRAIAKEYLKQAVFKLRAFHHQQRIAWQFGDSEAGADDEADDTRMRPLLRLMPEYSIPYVLHLLAHHPEYPDDDEPMDVEDGAQPGAPALEDPRLKSMLKCLQMLLEPISFAQGADAGNLAFLMNLATSIQNFHRDALDDDGCGRTAKIHRLARALHQHITKRIKSQENLCGFAQQVFLPRHLYSVLDDLAARAPASSGRRSTASARPHERATPKSARKGDAPDWAADISPITTAGGSAGSGAVRGEREPRAKRRRASEASSMHSIDEDEDVADDDADGVAEMPHRGKNRRGAAAPSTLAPVAQHAAEEDDAGGDAPPPQKQKPRAALKNTNKAGKDAASKSSTAGAAAALKSLASPAPSEYDFDEENAAPTKPATKAKGLSKQATKQAAAAPKRAKKAVAAKGR